MPYREDLEAAQARVEALEHELRELQSRPSAVDEAARREIVDLKTANHDLQLELVRACDAAPATGEAPSTALRRRDHQIADLEAENAALREAAREQASALDHVVIPPEPNTRRFEDRIAILEAEIVSLRAASHVTRRELEHARGLAEAREHLRAMAIEPLPNADPPAAPTRVPATTASVVLCATGLAALGAGVAVSSIGAIILAAVIVLVASFVLVRGDRS